MTVARRTVARRTVAAGLGLLLPAAAIRPAAALSLEPAPAPLADRYREACAAEAAFHAQLRAAVVEALSTDGAAPDAAAVDRALAAVACPRCGCPLAE